MRFTPPFVKRILQITCTVASDLWIRRPKRTTRRWHIFGFSMDLRISESEARPFHHNYSLSLKKIWHLKRNDVNLHTHWHFFIADGKLTILSHDGNRQNYRHSETGGGEAIISGMLHGRPSTTALRWQRITFGQWHWGNFEAFPTLFYISTSGGVTVSIQTHSQDNK